MEYHNIPLQGWSPLVNEGAPSPPAQQYNAPPIFACPPPALPITDPGDYKKPSGNQGKGHKRASSSMSSIFSLDYLKGKDGSKTESRGLLSEEYKETRRRYNWKAEILLGLVAVASTLAIIVLLVLANRRPLDSFKVPLGLVIAVLGATTRGTLAFAIGACLAQEKWNWLRRGPDSLLSFKKFDEASRGPMGSIELLYWLNLRHWATLGALVTVLLLGFDPLLQGAISYEGQLVDARHLLPPTIPFGGRLDAGIYAPNANAATHGQSSPKDNKTTVSLEHFSSVPDLSMATAIYNGFTSASSTVRFHCPSGNCTWPSFLSLGICSSCNDVSSHLIRETEVAASGTVLINTKQLGQPYTKYSLPYVSLSNPDSSHDSDLMAYMTVGVSTNTNDSVSHQFNDRLIAAVAVIHAADTYEKNQTSWAKTKVTATECALYFCIKRFDALVVKGDLEESEIEVETERVSKSFGPAATSDIDRFDVLQENLGAGLYSDSGDVARQDLQLRPSDKYSNATDLVIPAVFNISQNTVGSMVYFIRNEMFLGASKTLIWPPYEVDQGFFQSSAAQALYQSSDLAATMKRLATSLTNWARDTSSAATTPNHNTTTMVTTPQLQTQMLGTQQIWTLHVRVRWGYMSLPLATLLAGFVFVALSIRETRRLRLAPWKADVIATLAHSLDAETRAQLRFAARQGHVRQTSRELVLNFAESGHGFELKAQQRQEQGAPR